MECSSISSMRFMTIIYHFLCHKFLVVHEAGVAFLLDVLLSTSKVLYTNYDLYNIMVFGTTFTSEADPGVSQTSSH